MYYLCTNSGLIWITISNMPFIRIGIGDFPLLAPVIKD